MVTWATIALIAEWIIRVVMLVYVPNQRSPAAARTWLLLIFFLPWVGLVLYSLIGSVRVPRERYLRQRAVDTSVRDTLKRGTHLPVVPRAELSAHQRGLADLAERLGGYPVVSDNRVEFLSDYAGALERLVADIDTARHHVHLLTYIFRPDSTGDRVSEALIRARTRGVTCRVLLDAYGAKPGLQAYRRRWMESGVHVRAMNPVGIMQRNVARFDIRNHRKITIIDGALAHCGSQNVLDVTASLALPNEELVARVTVRWRMSCKACSVVIGMRKRAKTSSPITIFPTGCPAASALPRFCPAVRDFGRTRSSGCSLRCFIARSARLRSQRRISSPTT